MQILVLGGTVFLGRAVVETALADGHDVTTFTRGRSNPTLFDGSVAARIGDRRNDLGALDTGTWDLVIDCSGYFPEDVRASASLLRARAGAYVFVSSISVYDDTLAPGADEDAPVSLLRDAPADEITGESYGALKALCEAAAASVFGDRALTVRPGLIVGPHDPTDRFTYWPRRLAVSGDVLVPGTGDARAQVIDVRDLARFLISAGAAGASGTMNATGPITPFRDVVAACATGAVTPVWVDEAFLLEQGVQPWMEVPLWLPEGDDAMMQVSSARATAAGLTCRPLRETALDTLAWAQTLPADRPARAGLSPSREAALLTAWRAR